jgi:hypothetical protein
MSNEGAAAVGSSAVLGHWSIITQALLLQTKQLKTHKIPPQIIMFPPANKFREPSEWNMLSDRVR